MSKFIVVYFYKGDDMPNEIIFDTIRFCNSRLSQGYVTVNNRGSRTWVPKKYIDSSAWTFVLVSSMRQSYSQIWLNCEC